MQDHHDGSDRKADDGQLIARLETFARSLGEQRIVRSRAGVANLVFLGDRLVFKVRLSDADHPGGADLKEGRVLDLLAHRLPPAVRRLVPGKISETMLPGVGFVLVQTRLPGERPEAVTQKLFAELGAFLFELHKVGSATGAIDEFENGPSASSFRGYARTKPALFAQRLLGLVDAGERALIERSLAEIARIAERIPDAIPLVLLHKDLSLDNLLQDQGRLCGVIDWEAAQTGPREWEFAILKQRFPESWELIKQSYQSGLDEELLLCCGLIQGLRFWKSYPHHRDFVAQIKRDIESVLD